MKYKNKYTVLNKIDINKKKMCSFLILTLFLIFSGGRHVERFLHWRILNM